MESIPEKVSEVEPFLEQVNKHLGLGEVEFHKLLVATTEAVNNAIIHGNKSQSSKQVNITVRLTKHYVIIKVHDEGVGFNPDVVPNPLEEENLLKESGRGLFLMKTLMDEVEVRKTTTGCEVRMSLYIGPKRGLRDSDEE